MATKKRDSSEAQAKGQAQLPGDADAARARVQETGRNDPCPCGSGKKYKKCHLQSDEAAASPPPGPPDPMDHVQSGWRLFEQRRPGAAEKEFRAALALKPDLVEAQVGVGLAKLSAGDADAARRELAETVKTGEAALAKLREEKATDGFSRRETQPYLRASHALGCLAFDQGRYDDALVAFERVYGVDRGPVGTEARLIAGKTLLRLERAADAVAMLEEAAGSESGPVRAHMGLVLAHFRAGNAAAAEASLERALADNPYLGKALLGQIRKQVDNPLGAAPGSREEAVVYAQTYGDVWDDPAREFLEQALAARAQGRRKGEDPQAGAPAADQP